jgi:membrane-associated HD superfamily phosphohydrolase
MKRYDIILKRYDIILKHYDIILKRYDIILKRYDIILKHYKRYDFFTNVKFSLKVFGTIFFIILRFALKGQSHKKFGEMRV